MNALNVDGAAGAKVFSPDEFEMMARLLERRHGAKAAEIADFFALEHRMIGDIGRASAWFSVASILRRRSTGNPNNSKRTGSAHRA